MADRFDGYAVSVFLDEDGDYIAHFLELPEVSAHGKSPEKALKELASAWQGVKLLYEEEGRAVPVAPLRRNFSGQFNVRLDRRVHRALAVEAARAGLTLNALVSQKLAKFVQL